MMKELKNIYSLLMLRSEETKIYTGLEKVLFKFNFQHYLPLILLDMERTLRFQKFSVNYLKFVLKCTPKIQIPEV